MGEVVGDRYRVAIGSQSIELPIVPLSPERAISLLMTIDVGVGFLATAGADLAEAIADARPEIVASAATLGIPVAYEVTRALGLDDYLILQKTPKLHLADARIRAVAGKRVALVDDVIATGGSIRASAALLRAAGAEVVVIGSLLVEGAGWRSALGEDAELVRSIGRIPMFDADGTGGWQESWD